MLIERFDIQINKTSRNTVLFMVNIGSTRGSATYLLDVLLQIAEDLDGQAEEQSELDRARSRDKVRALVSDLPPLPGFSRFHVASAPGVGEDAREGDMRAAFFLSYDDAVCDHVRLDARLVDEVRSGRALASASFVTPYPPGFPVLVPGQVVTADVLTYLLAVDVKEIHGYDADHGLRIFRPDVLARLQEAASSPDSLLLQESIQ
jgi:arginine decarboxylase